MVQTRNSVMHSNRFSAYDDVARLIFGATVVMERPTHGLGFEYVHKSENANET